MPEYILAQVELILRAVLRDIPVAGQVRRQTAGLVRGSEAIEYQRAQILIYGIGRYHTGRVDRVDRLRKSQHSLNIGAARCPHLHSDNLRW
jgi:hypothetical protein